MKSIFIVESENDKYFCDRFIRCVNTDVQLVNAEIAPPLCEVNDYHCMSGLNKGKLVSALNAIRNRARKEPIAKIGIVVDIDDKSTEDRLALINEAISESEFNTQEEISETNSFINVKVDEDITIQIACYFTNIDSKGNLDTLLKGIKTGESKYADCLNAWRKCIETNGKSIKESDFDKFWLTVYTRYDQCSREEQKQAGRKCNFEVSLEKNIWDFNSSVLDSFKEFVLLFSNS
jgi:hypothetical protein